LNHNWHFYSLIALCDIIPAAAGLYVMHRIGSLFEAWLAPTRAWNQHLEY